jgi:hypothetical protein
MSVCMITVWSSFDGGPRLSVNRLSGGGAGGSGGGGDRLRRCSGRRRAAALQRRRRQAHDAERDSFKAQPPLPPRGRGGGGMAGCGGGGCRGRSGRCGDGGCGAGRRRCDRGPRACRCCTPAGWQSGRLAGRQAARWAGVESVERVGPVEGMGGHALGERQVGQVGLRASTRGCWLAGWLAAGVSGRLAGRPAG